MKVQFKYGIKTYSGTADEMTYGSYRDGSVCIGRKYVVPSLTAQNTSLGAKLKNLADVFGDCSSGYKDLTNLQSLYLTSTERKITLQGAVCISSGVLPKDTILLSSRALIGYVALVTQPSVINQGFIAMKCINPFHTYFLLLWTINNIDNIKQYANGSTFLEINKENFRKIEIPIPSNKVMMENNAICRPLFENMKQLSESTHKLIETKNIIQAEMLGQ
ncbi:MAG: hypothetical protein CVU50_00460 [Candidatus Cloacimonetes bacterium HGW-Cloacimonetes-3]|nr:MAG: hypothetical protein CVU50_00460 [Candidatus Cloacimonetes bacterium HGW-Cloacimonetes-3]